MIGLAPCPIASSMMRQLPRVVSSGSMEYYLDSSVEEMTRQASHCSLVSFCSLADLPAYAFDVRELRQMLEPCTVPLIVSQPGPTRVWEYVRVPRRPDSATSNSLCSGDEEAMREVVMEDDDMALGDDSLSDSGGGGGDNNTVPTGATAVMPTVVEEPCTPIALERTACSVLCCSLVPRLRSCGVLGARRHRVRRQLRGVL